MGWDAEDAEAARWSDETNRRSVEAARRSAEAVRRSAEAARRSADMGGTAEHLRTLIEQAKAELARLEARPAEPVEGTVVRFALQYTGSGRVYTFAAICANSKWYVTGNGALGRGVSWSDLLDWIERAGKLVGPIQIATGWGDLP